MNSWLTGVLRAGISAAGAPDAPLASDNDNPAAPNTGTAFLRRFRFEACFAYDMAETSRTCGYQTKRLYAQCNRR
jgi:hypothetical protein